MEIPLHCEPLVLIDQRDSDADATFLIVPYRKLGRTAPMVDKRTSLSEKFTCTFIQIDDKCIISLGGRMGVARERRRFQLTLKMR